jgi:hypothetical protein
MSIRMSHGILQQKATQNVTKDSGWNCGVGRSKQDYQSEWLKANNSEGVFRVCSLFVSPLAKALEHTQIRS